MLKQQRHVDLYIELQDNDEDELYQWVFEYKSRHLMITYNKRFYHKDIVT